MRSLCRLSVAAACVCVATFPALGSGVGGTVALPQLDRTAQSFALGNDGATLTGLNALSVNPAGLYTPHAEVLTQYQQLPMQTNLAVLGASYPMAALKTALAVSYASLRSSNFEGRDEDGRATGGFSTQDQMVGVHLSRPVDIGLPMTAGVSVKYLSMAVGSQSGGAALFDVGGRWTLRRWPLTIGLSAVNLGQGPKLGERRSDLPTSYIISGAYPVIPGLDLIGNFAWLAKEGRRDFNVGAQFWLGDFASLRGCLATAQGGAAGGVGFQNMALGTGIKLMRRHTLDYTFQPFDASMRQTGSAGTHRLTLTLRFSGSAVPRAGGALTSARALAKERQLYDASQAMTQRAWSALRAGRYEESAARMEAALEADESNRAAQAALPRLNAVTGVLGSAREREGALASAHEGVLSYVKQGDARGSVARMREAVDQAPEDGRMLKLLNLVERKAGKEQTKLGWGESGAGLAERKLAQARGRTYDGDYKGAARLAREVLEMQPGNKTAWQVLGSVSYLAGDLGQARQAWERALRIDPEDQAVAAYLMKVGRK
ncbi:MAG: tetratricopeptide repeat protein [Elusimicrobia bacterium]|nr:tetratricopeptide repeat protein [Elusimicrobiota bacterium]